MKFVRIPPGKLLMGSPKKEKGREEDEGPQHEVEITKAFYLAVYPVTQAEYRKIMEWNPSAFSTKGCFSEQVKGLDTTNFPVETVGWTAAGKFCEKLTAMEQEKQAKRSYRLPTEAEWEYACRAGTKTVFNCGDRLSPTQANFDAAKLGRTCKVGSYKPNAWGLYEMHGNVAQWCSDWYDKNYYQTSPKKDPPGTGNWEGQSHARRLLDVLFIVREVSLSLVAPPGRYCFHLRLPCGSLPGLTARPAPITARRVCPHGLPIPRARIALEEASPKRTQASGREIHGSAGRERVVVW
jgi:formylglycine-generating enzyme required for sulfatase activity